MSFPMPTKPSSLSRFAVWRRVSGDAGFCRTCAWCLLAILGGIVLYGAAYWLSMTPYRTAWISTQTMTRQSRRRPAYLSLPWGSSACSWSDLAYSPAHQVDRWIRPAFWNSPLVSFDQAELLVLQEREFRGILLTPNSEYEVIDDPRIVVRNPSP